MKMIHCHQGYENKLTKLFSFSQGALVSALADDTLHLWNLRQKRPAILHSLKFNRERQGLHYYCFAPYHHSMCYCKIRFINALQFTTCEIIETRFTQGSSCSLLGPKVFVSRHTSDLNCLFYHFVYCIAEHHFFFPHL